MVSVIMPQKAKRQQQQQQQQTAPQARETTYESDHAAMIAEAVARQGPPPAGMGKLVDKTV